MHISHSSHSLESSQSGFQAPEHKFCPWDGYKFLENESECPNCNHPRFKTPNNQSMNSIKEPKVWKKILYEKQPFEDNYLDQTFLSCLVTKDTYKNLVYKDIVFNTTEISFAISLIVLFLIIFHFLLNKKVSEQVLILILFIFGVTGTFIFIILSPKIFKIHSILSNIKSIGIILGTLFLFSPVMKTIFQNYAENTTYALTFGLILYHLIAKDYNSEASPSVQEFKIDTATLSSFFFSLLLASRLGNEFQVFALLFVSIQFFVFSRFLKKSIQDFSKKIFCYFLVAFFLALFGVLYNLSRFLAFLYMFSLFFITFLCPLWLIWLYQYKNVIHGPWDLPYIRSYNID